MDDLVRRLRECKGDIYQMVCMMSEAASRIEQLELTLHHFRSIPQGKYTVWIKDDSTIAWKSEGAFMFFDGDRKYTIAWEKKDV